MKKDPKLTAEKAAEKIKDKVDANFDLTIVDIPFITEVLKALHLRINPAMIAHIASLLFGAGVLGQQEYPKMLYQKRDDGSIKHHKVMDADEEKALVGVWFNSPKEAKEGYPAVA